jgi:para-nitrobenzyl esterase
MLKLFKFIVIPLFVIQGSILSAKDIISTSSGIVKGFEKDQVMNWHDIPYAEPPVGDLRWRAPKSISKNENVILPKEGNFCVQKPYERGGAPGEENVSGTEDCLYLDIQAPIEYAQEKLPVMFWIHGGGNTSGLKDIYNFAKLVKREKVIVVSINYRLGAFGWFTHPAIQSFQSGLDKSSNYGTLDIIAALRWTQKNIEKFGGDHNNITIFGESAGGHNVLSLLVSKEAKGLFHKAISQSGYTTTYSLEEAYNPRIESNTSEASSASIFKKLLISIEYPISENVIGLEEKRKILKEIDPYTFFLLYQDENILNIPLITEDDISIPLEGMKAALGNPDHLNSVPTIAGSNRDEVKLWLAAAEYFVRLDKSFIGNMIGLPKPIIRDKHTYQVFNYFRATAWQLRGVIQPLSAIYAAGNEDVYGYRFDWDDHRRYLIGDFSELLGAFHASEIPLISGNKDIVGNLDFILYPAGPSKRFTEKNMMKFWANFAKNGSPGISSNKKAWEPFIVNDEQSIMILDKKSEIGMDKYNKDLNSLIDELELNSVINENEKCALLFQITTFVGEDIFDNHQSRLDGKCTREQARRFLDENNGVIEF